MILWKMGTELHLRIHAEDGLKDAIEAYRAGVPAEDVVKMMCLYPAEMLGIDQRLGTIEAGKDADISVFSGHPVTTYAAKVVHSIVNGEVLF